MVINSTAKSRGKTLLRGAYAAYTPTAKGAFENAGKFGNIPHFGDVIYFYYEKKGRIGHTGVVKKVVKNGAYYTITTIEGNTSSNIPYSRDGGGVFQKEYVVTLAQIGGKNHIAGFGTPAFSEATCTAEEFVAEAESWLGYLEKASGGTEEQLKNKNWNVGKNNYTYFGLIYEALTGLDGYDNAQWCAEFVCGCAYLACLKRIEKKNKEEWKKENGKWYCYKNGEKIKNGLATIDGKTYFFDENGVMLADAWRVIMGFWYYFGKDGAMFFNTWKQHKDKWYFLNADGKMAAGAYVYYAKYNAYCWVDNEGVWNGKYYVIWDDNAVRYVREITVG